MYDYVVIGGGASGLVTSIFLARNNKNVIVLEKNNVCGRKLLITGNGRCNYFNSNISIDNYRTSNKEILEEIITKNNLEKVLKFFDSIGIYPRIKDGYYYPYSNTATAICNSLLVEVKRLNIKIITNTTVLDITKDTNFNIITNNGNYIGEKVVLATGSLAFPKTGSDGVGYNILKKLGHQVIKPLPALVQLLANTNYLKEWDGIRTDASIKLYIDNNEQAKEQGELQLTSYGISGICIMNLSGRIARALDNNKKVILRINFLPQISNLKTYIEDRNENILDRTIIELLESLINYKLLYLLLKLCFINSNKRWNELNDKDKNDLINKLNSFELEITGTKDYNNAQTCTGGVILSEVDPKTLESKLINNLFISSELLDVDGDCGGYNLAFAWLSGIIIGSAK